MDWRIYSKLRYNIRVNEAAQEITLLFVKGDVEGARKRILSLRTETPRCEIHSRAVSSDAATDEASAGRSDPERRVRLVEATQGLSREMVQSSGRSTHDESLFHMAERIPQGTRRNRRVSVEDADSDKRVRGGIETASRGSKRAVANSNDHEIRLVADRVQS